MKTDNLNPLYVSPNNIWNYKQNHPELVIEDLRSAGFSDMQLLLVRASMLARGINKWLKVRRDLIAYKKQIKHEIKELQVQIPLLKENMSNKWMDFKIATIKDVYNYFKEREKYIVAKELLKYKEKVRSDLKKLCMTERWQLWQNMKIEEMNTINCSD